ncbi:MAG: hypothetical protein LAT50_05145 [Ectothiorhodospiraceae bacterium]|nr:hypothetical protein [Ectothiorhodospiraceae bacterium]
MPQSATSRQLAGVLLLVACAATILAGVMDGSGRLLGGAAAGGAAILLWPQTTRRSRWQTLILAGLGFAGVGYGVSRGVSPDVARIISGNMGLIALLIGITFLQLVTSADSDDDAGRPGPRAFRTTSLGVHLFGAVINMSAVFIVGDRMRRYGPLRRLHGILLTRSFSTAGLWSPFFAAMGAALSFAPGAQILVLIAIGTSLTLVALGTTWFTMARQADHAFHGYPLKYANLRVPAIMAVLVIIAHLLLPDVPILIIVTATAPLIALAYLLPRGRTGRRTLIDHIRFNLPGINNEVWLFISAGVLAAGIASVLAATGDWQPFSRVTALEAWLVAGGITAIAAIGIHPIITVAAAATLLDGLPTNENLLAMAFLFGWTMGMCINPLSGLNLSLQARYGIQGIDMMRANARYVMGMLLVFGALLWLAEHLLGGY